jgi:hypothetical protein
MADRTVTITLTQGEPTIGLWCEHCALPSRVEIPLHMLTQHGVSNFRTVTYCTEHGRD